MPSFYLSALLLFAASQITTSSFSLCVPREYRGVRREVWKGLNGGWYLAHLTSDLRFPDQPKLVENISSFTPPRNDANNYGQRLQAYFIPPVRGNYTFYATCDSECALYLSVDEEPGNKAEIIRIDQDHRTGYNQWNTSLQRSCPQELEKGKFYYIEALHCNYVADDHVRIHIKFPGSSIVRSLGQEFLFLYLPDYSARTTCIVLRGCGVTCGGGKHTHIRTRNWKTAETCNAKNKRIVRDEPFSLQVRAANVTSSSVVVTWKALGQKASFFDVKGYEIAVKANKNGARVREVNTTVSSLSFKGLNSSTNYCITVEPLTILKGNIVEECYNFTTKDGVPASPPQNISAVSENPSSIVVKWRPIPESEKNGDILGYRVTYKFMSAAKQVEPPKDKQTEKWPGYSSVLGPQLFLVGLRDVKPYTWYCVQMLGFTKHGEGKKSPCFFVLTEQSAPSLPPQNITTTALGNASFSVAWQPVPPANTHGVVIGYKVFYSPINSTSLPGSKTVNYTQTRVTIHGLPASTRFCVNVLAFTDAGGGPNSSCVEAWTWSHEILFPKLKAGSYSSPFSIAVTWDAPADHVLSQLTHYHVTYKPIKEADVSLVNPSSTERNVSVDSRFITLNNLATYTRYEIGVQPILKNGKVQEKKILFAETCRCPHLMLASWRPSPPYVIADGSNKPGGIMPQILARILQTSCGKCFSFKSWNISYTDNSTESITEPDTHVQVDFRFPVRSAVERSMYRGHTYVPLIQVPGVALMTKRKTPSAYARDLGSSMIGCWPIFAISFVMAILTGVLVWFAESKANSKQFFTYQFHKGIVEGIWWSLVTMTTVGYGDRYPKTVLGRSIAIVWFMTGMIMSSLLISSITSSLSVRMLDEKFNLARGKKVASLAQFPEYDLLIKLMSKAVNSSTYPTLEKLLRALKFGDVDGILVDVYTAHYREDLFNKTWIQVSQIIQFEFTSGVVISGNAAKLEREFRQFYEKRSIEVTKILQKTNEKKDKVVPKSSRSVPMRMPILDPSTPVYHLTVFLLVAFLCLAIMIGMVYHTWYKKKQKWRHEIQSFMMRETEEYLKTRVELKAMVEDFHKRFVFIYKRMRAKHVRQLERLKKPMNDTNGTISQKHLKGVWV